MDQTPQPPQHTPENQDMDQTTQTPQYTPAEEICNCLVHFAGSVAAVIGAYRLVAASDSPSYVISALIYGVALFSMFVTSTMYHAIRDQEVKAFVRKFDHAMIYFAIGGTYVPIVNALLPPVQGMIWYGGLGLCAVVGAVSSFLTLKHKYITTAVYLVMGWASLLLLPKMLHLPEEFHASGSRMAGMLIGGGVVYSVGAALYLIKLRFVHSVFHVFVVGGAVLQYLAIRMLYS